MLEHTHLFLQFCKSNKVHCEDVALKISTLTLGGRVMEWCKTFPSMSIYSFEQFIKELQHAFDRYDFQSLFNNINALRLKPHKPLDDFANRFLHLCYQFFERYVDWMYLNEKFQQNVFFSLKQFQYKLNPVSTNNHENMQVTN